MVNTQTIPAFAPTQDSIYRDFAQIPTESPQIRRLTVNYGTYGVRGPDGRAMPIPMLRLQGAWLERAGFAIGATVKVHMSRGRLVIEAVKSEPASQAEALGVLGALLAEKGLSKRDLDDIGRQLRRMGRAD
jgi:hypothetical protein